MAKAKNPKAPVSFVNNPPGTNRKVHFREKSGNHIYFFIEPTGNVAKEGPNKWDLKDGGVKICI
jgi:hypothetical protein